MQATAQPRVIRPIELRWIRLILARDAVTAGIACFFPFGMSMRLDARMQPMSLLPGLWRTSRFGRTEAWEPWGDGSGARGLRRTPTMIGFRRMPIPLISTSIVSPGSIHSGGV